MSDSTYKTPPKISIVIAVFNGAKTFQECLDSFTQQTYQYKELLVIDGGSTDGTIDLIIANQQHMHYWISEPDKGIYDAWNKALKHASGDWVSFLGADDTLLPNALQNYSSYLQTHEDEALDYVSSKVNLVSGDKFIRTIGKPWKWHAFKRYMNVAHVGSLHHKRLYEKYGGYDTSYKICADYEFLLRPKASLKAGFLNIETVDMSIGGASDSNAALIETARAKVTSGGRNKLIAKFESKFAIFRMYVRKRIWY
jgi:glycosyltransferase involved in cell wall biosynthesis